MPKSFVDKESQIQYFLMVCKMRGMTIKEIHAEITSTLKIDISINSLYNRLQTYEESNAKHFHELKKSNHAYISRIMELVNHFEYYRKVIMTVLNDPKNKQSITPSMLFKSTELLQKLDQTEFNMLERIPDIFSWKQINNHGGRDPRYGLNIEDSINEKNIDEYVLSIEQIPVPYDLQALQHKTENESIVDKNSDNRHASNFG